MVIVLYFLLHLRTMIKIISVGCEEDNILNKNVFSLYKIILYTVIIYEYYVLYMCSYIVLEISY